MDMQDILEELESSIKHLKTKKYNKARQSLIRATFCSRLYEHECTGERWRYYKRLTIELEHRITKIEQKYRLN